MDSQTKTQIVDYAVANAVLEGGERRNYRNAVEFLKEKGIELIPTKRIYARAEKPITTTYLRSREKKIRTTGELILPANLRGKIGPRTEKDKMYERMWTLVDIFLKPDTYRKYVGLAGMYLPAIKRRLGKNSEVVCCERDHETFSWLTNLKLEFFPTQEIYIVRKDIFRFLKKINYCPNIIDLDLMQCLTKSLVDKIVKTLNDLPERVESNPLIINIVSTVGRGNSWEDHKREEAHLMEKIGEIYADSTINITSGNYLERRHPIAYNMFALSGQK